MHLLKCWLSEMTEEPSWLHSLCRTVRCTSLLPSTEYDDSVSTPQRIRMRLVTRAERTGSRICDEFEFVPSGCSRQASSAAMDLRCSLFSDRRCTSEGIIRNSRDGEPPAEQWHKAELLIEKRSRVDWLRGASFAEESWEFRRNLRRSTILVAITTNAAGYQRPRSGTTT